MAERDAGTIDRAILSEVLRQNSENLRNIKSERIWFLQTFAVLSAGTQSLLLSVRAEPLLQLGLSLPMAGIAAIGLLISLRLKAELEECLEKLHALVVHAQVEEFMALERPEGDLLRYPQFRGMFPVFYVLAVVVFAAQAAHSLMAAMAAS